LIDLPSIAGQILNQAPVIEGGNESYPKPCSIDGNLPASVFLRCRAMQLLPTKRPLLVYSYPIY